MSVPDYLAVSESDERGICHARAAALGWCPTCASAGQYVPTVPGGEACLTHSTRPAEWPVEPSTPAAHSETSPPPGRPGTGEQSARRAPFPAKAPDGRYRAPHPVAVAAMLPAGARRARDQSDALAALDRHPARDELRVDRAERYGAIWRALVYAADWRSMTVTGTWDRIADQVGVSRSTVARAVRWLRGAGLLGVVYSGASAAALRSDVNRAPTYVLAVPAAADVPEVREETPAHSPVETIDTPPAGERSVDDLNARASSDTTSAPLRGLATSTTTRGAAWSMSTAPATRRDRLAAAEALLWQAPTIRRMSARLLRHVLRSWWDAGWSPNDVLYALDHTPDGQPWRYVGRVHTPAAWIRHRLAAWRDQAGAALPSRTQRVRAAGEALRARRAQRAHTNAGYVA